jgi:hypothetical protein
MKERIDKFDLIMVYLIEISVKLNISSNDIAKSIKKIQGVKNEDN